MSLLVSDWYFLFYYEFKICYFPLSVLSVMGEHTSSLRKFPTQHIMCMCGLIITLSICSVQVVSRRLQGFNCLCHKHKMNTAVSNFLFAKKEWL
jgi:hypothetical protein